MIEESLIRRVMHHSEPLALIVCLRIIFLRVQSAQDQLSSTMPITP